MMPPRSSRCLVSIDGPETFAKAFGVSRETANKLATYHQLAGQWQKAINLVAPSTLPDLWQRHFADSAQLAALVPDAARRHVDLGSGGGFPGLVVAIMLADRPGFRTTLIDSDQRKTAFLREVARRTRIAVEIVCGRIENAETQARLTAVDVVTARALAPLDKLLTWAAPLFGADTVGLFPKGRGARQELADAQVNWRFEYRTHQSLTESEACVVEVRHLFPAKEA